jgi:hypothetical protein
MTFAERLVPILREADFVGAWELLESLEGDELREAKAWFEIRDKGGYFGDIDWVGGTRDEVYDTKINASWIVSMCALRLCGPVTAARRAGWDGHWNYQRFAGEAHFVQRLWDMDRDWVAAFVTEASQVRLRNARNVNANLSRVVRAAVVHHELPCPSGATFLAAWSAGAGRLADWDWRDKDPERGVAWLSSDPLMPELLFHYLASGHCGASRWLPGTVARLAADGKVDRDALVQHVLTQLTSAQPPAAQIVLGGILDSLDLRAPEVPGGLAYLLGVISTSKGAVGKVLLPTAIELVRTPTDVYELAVTVAGRAEKKQKDVLLTALKGNSLRDRVGVESVREALGLLATDEDVDFRNKVTAVLSRVGGSPLPDMSDDPPATGVWDMEPRPSGEPYPPLAWQRRGYRPPDATWTYCLYSGGDAAQDVPIRGHLVDVTLTALADGRPVRDEALVEITDLQRRGKLSVPHLVRVLGDVFLGGGMRDTYPLALEIADLLCGAARKPAGLADYLRFLAQYAGEVPVDAGIALPSQVAALAATTSSTKAREEARRLGARLAHVDLATYVSSLTAHLEATRREPATGLWKERSRPAEPLLWEIRLPEPGRVSDLKRLRTQFEDYLGDHEAVRAELHFMAGLRGRDLGGATLSGPDLLLAAVVKAVGVYGVSGVRDALRGAGRQHPPATVIAAIDAWASGALTENSYWTTVARLAADAGNAGGAQEDPVIGPLGHLGRRDPAGRTAFLRAAESLVLAGQNNIVLAAPTWADCTLEFDDLVARLVAVEGKPIGPMDLVQALHRLRPTDPSRLVQLDRLAAVKGTWRTAANVTSPEGTESWDVLDLVYRWIAAGGLPPLEEYARDGRWTTDAVAPVPWSACRALPADLRDDPWSPGYTANAARMLPLWSDRANPPSRAYSADWSGYPLVARMMPPLGARAHDAIYGAFVHDHDTMRFEALKTIGEVLDYGLVSAGQMAKIATGRHSTGTLALQRLVPSLEVLFNGGHLSAMWPSAVAMAEALCGVPRRPTGLADLLRLLVNYVHEVPQPGVPDGFRALAQGAGKTKAHQEARRYVELVDSM